MQVGVSIKNANHRVFKNRSVINARTYDDLTIHRDVMFKKLSQPTQTHSASRVAQHLTTNRRISGMNTDVQRRESLGNHALKISLGKPCQCRKIAIEKTQAIVIIFEIQTLAHPRR